MVGWWVLTKESQKKIINIAGFKIFTNRTDHILVLNKDGTCIYRAMDSYSGFFGSQSEDAQYNNFPGEEQPAYRYTLSAYETWYVWDGLSTNLLTGPFSRRPLNADGKVMKNKWDWWSLVKRESDRDGYKGRYRLSFHHSNTSPYLCGKFWFIGENDGRLFLWQWIYAPSLNTVVEFEKSDLASVRKLAREEYTLRQK